MVYCVVNNCESNKQKNHTNLKFHRFPNDENRRQVWINACGNPSVNHRTGTICSAHFIENDYRLKDRLLNLPLKKRMLNENAVPTKNIFCSEISKQRTARCCRREAKNIVREVLKDSIERVSEVQIDDGTCLQNIEVEVVKSVEVQTEIDIECAREFKIMELEEALKAAKKEIKILKERNDELRKLESSVSKIFTKGQIEKLKNPDNKISWTLDDISAATCLHSSGPRAYRFLYAKRFPLPGTSTLRHWATKLNVRAGILQIRLQDDSNNIK